MLVSPAACSATATSITGTTSISWINLCGIGSAKDRVKKSGPQPKSPIVASGRNGSESGGRCGQHRLVALLAERAIEMHGIEAIP